MNTRSDTKTLFFLDGNDTNNDFPPTPPPRAPHALNTPARNTLESPFRSFESLDASKSASFGHSAGAAPIPSRGAGHARSANRPDSASRAASPASRAAAVGGDQRGSRGAAASRPAARLYASTTRSSSASTRSRLGLVCASSAQHAEASLETPSAATHALLEAVSSLNVSDGSEGRRFSLAMATARSDSLYERSMMVCASATFRARSA